MITQCWHTVQIFQCRDANKTAGTDGSILVVPLPFIGFDEPENTTLLCPMADADVVGE